MFFESERARARVCVSVCVEKLKAVCSFEPHRVVVQVLFCFVHPWSPLVPLPAGTEPELLPTNLPIPSTAGLITRVTKVPLDVRRTRFLGKVPNQPHPGLDRNP